MNKLINYLDTDKNFKNLFFKKYNKNLWKKKDNKNYWEKLEKLFGIKSLPVIEIYRIQIIKNLEIKIKSKFNLDKSFSLVLLLLNENNHKKDPILTKITNNNILKNKKIREYLNKQIIRNIEIILFIKNHYNFVNDEMINDKEAIKKSIFLSFNIALKYNYPNKINNKIYNRLRIQYSNFIKNYSIFGFNILIKMNYYRYDRLGLLTGMQGAVHPIKYKKFSEIYNSNIEMFGSFINHTLDNYYGLFPDLEEKFGCLGNFFNSKIKEGYYITNPPFDYFIIHKTFNHLVKLLKNTNKKLTFFIIIPAWYNMDRIELNKICNNQLSIEDYGHEMNFKILETNNYLKKNFLYCKNNFSYYSYLKNKTVFFTATNLIILSNRKRIDTKFKSIFENPDIIKK
tara:strand:- start:2828 stop:4021 length:1194 start_codon:yes stop_codon:yes gene_type:complete